MDIESYLGVYGSEMRGVAKGSALPLGDVVLGNFIYELSAECTSIIAADENGYLYHGRNLDFGAGGNFTEALQATVVNINFTRQNETAYAGTTFTGYVGLLTGMSKKRFSVTIDMQVGPMYNLLENYMTAILDHKSAAISLLVRELFDNDTIDYKEAVYQLSTRPLVAPVYYIVGGYNLNEGAVITRDRFGANDTWALTPPGRWFEVETNYNHWEAPPPTDDRVDPANRGMEAMGRANISFAGIYQVLSTKPVLNRLTTYTALMRVPTGEYFCAERKCQAPCPN